MICECDQNVMRRGDDYHDAYYKLSVKVPAAIPPSHCHETQQRQQTLPHRRDDLLVNEHNLSMLTTKYEALLRPLVDGEPDHEYVLEEEVALIDRQNVNAVSLNMQQIQQPKEAPIGRRAICQDREVGVQRGSTERAHSTQSIDRVCRE